MGRFGNIGGSAMDLVHISDVLDTLGIFHTFYPICYWSLCDRHNWVWSSPARKKSSQPFVLSTLFITNTIPTCSCLPSLHSSCISVCMLGNTISHVCNDSFLSCVEVSGGVWLVLVKNVRQCKSHLHLFNCRPTLDWVVWEGWQVFLQEIQEYQGKDGVWWKYLWWSRFWTLFYKEPQILCCWSRYSLRIHFLCLHEILFLGIQNK